MIKLGNGSYYSAVLIFLKDVIVKKCSAGTEAKSNNLPDQRFDETLKYRLHQEHCHLSALLLRTLRSLQPQSTVQPAQGPHPLTTFWPHHPLMPSQSQQERGGCGLTRHFSVSCLVIKHGWGLALIDRLHQIWNMKVFPNKMLLIHVCDGFTGSAQMMSHDSVCAQIWKHRIKKRTWIKQWAFHTK